MTVWVVEEVCDHAAGWIWGVFSTRQLADEWCAATGQDSVEINQFVLDSQIEKLFTDLTQNPEPPALEP